MKQYEFSTMAAVPKGVTAADAGSAIEGLISEHGEVRPEHLLNLAREDNHPLHRCFEWDDTRAGEQYRLEQARRLIRSVVIVREERPDINIRAFVNVDRGGGWRTVEAVLANPDDRAHLIQQALSDLRAFQRKYSTLTELAEVQQAIAAYLPAEDRTEPAHRRTISSRSAVDAPHHRAET